MRVGANCFPPIERFTVNVLHLTGCPSISNSKEIDFPEGGGFSASRLARMDRNSTAPAADFFIEEMKIAAMILRYRQFRLDGRPLVPMPYLPPDRVRQNQWSCIGVRNSRVIGSPDADPMTASIVHFGQSAV
jgi:hypothetical protein